MEGHEVRGPVAVVVSGKVLLEPVKDVVLVEILQHALVHVRAEAAFERADVVRVERELPQTCGNEMTS